MPSQTTGTLTLADLRANRNTSIVAYGLDTINEVLQRDLTTYNGILLEVVGELADVSSDRQRLYGTSADSAAAEEADEFDPGVAKKPPSTGVTCGFPLRKYPFPLGWTYDYFLAATPADMAEAALARQRSDTRTVLRDLKKALFLPTNATFRDTLEPPTADLAVKRLLNADSADIPDGPNGETFTGSSHTHYDFIDSATPTAAGLLAQIADVIEHGHGNAIRIYINSAAESAVRALTGFAAYVDPRVVYRVTDTPGQALDISRVNNRAIGIFGAAEVWVKPWVPAGYTFCFDYGDSNKPLVYRQPAVAALRGLRLVATMPDHPLYAETMEHRFGFGVWTRTNGHVLYYASGASAYVAPTITG